jgi:hypothetical protein
MKRTASIFGFEERAKKQGDPLLAHEVTPQNMTSSCCSRPICYSDSSFPVHHHRNNPAAISGKYCDMWAVSRKRMGKHFATERLIPGNQLISEHGFQGYGNRKL